MFSGDDESLSVSEVFISRAKFNLESIMISYQDEWVYAVDLQVIFAHFEELLNIVWPS